MHRVLSLVLDIGELKYPEYMVSMTRGAVGNTYVRIHDLAADTMDVYEDPECIVHSMDGIGEFSDPELMQAEKRLLEILQGGKGA